MKNSIWYWKSNQYPWSNGELHEKEEWKPYSDIENQIIEEAFVNNESEVELDNYMINLQQKIQLNKNDKTKQRQIKRSLNNNCTIQCLRDERFSVPHQLCEPFKEYIGYSKFFHEWNNKYVNESGGDLFESAAQGIVIEGGKVGKKVEAQWIAKQLVALKECHVKKVTEGLISLYTLETFLYKLINKTLRDEDLDKLDTLGPFCALLAYYLMYLSLQHDPNLVYHGLVYRGVTLDRGQIEQYERALGTIKKWTSFNSASKNRSLAQIYGNTLIIIQIQRPYSVYAIQCFLCSLCLDTDIFLKFSRSFYISDMWYKERENEKRKGSD
ncbi:unnamed protein product [Didymodactylos carnosus]|uniref:WWE domain-containing protein n=1 Tax=Didymodactylos carnosus TaxID=1234261 RepID=A0A8S2U3A0_9BILA|nr:unnamed protein product [Didymodactylos carnosus]CAF4321357.1 unnamed protein product [Didymodactylos carnosus]